MISIMSYINNAWKILWSIYFSKMPYYLVYPRKKLFYYKFKKIMIVKTLTCKLRERLPVTRMTIVVADEMKKLLVFFWSPRPSLEHIFMIILFLSFTTFCGWTFWLPHNLQQTSWLYQKVKNHFLFIPIKKLNSKVKE